MADIKLKSLNRERLHYHIFRKYAMLHISSFFNKGRYLISDFSIAPKYMNFFFFNFTTLCYVYVISEKYTFSTKVVNSKFLEESANLTVEIENFNVIVSE